MPGGRTKLFQYEQMAINYADACKGMVIKDKEEVKTVGEVEQESTKAVKEVVKKKRRSKKSE